MGNPIAHSKSPFIHALFAEQVGDDIDYQPLLVDEREFTQNVMAFFDQGGSGLNITVPFKQHAWQLADVLSERAQQAGAVNTLFLDESSRLVGDNTDGIGIVKDIISNIGIDIESKRLLILGAGGAVRGVLGPLLAENPGALVVANRSATKATDLVAEFGPMAQLRSASFKALNDHPFDLIINGTSASLEGALPAIPESLFTRDVYCYDMMYGAEKTAFNQWADGSGVKATYDGLGMLVEQAAESYLIWRGTRPETVPVIRRLRKLLHEES